MSKVWIVARHEFLVNVRRAGFIIMTLIVPFLGLLILLIAAAFGGQASDFFERTFAPQPEEIGVADHSGIFTPINPAYRDRYRLFADEEAGRAAVEADELPVLLIIPEDYMERGQVLVLTRGSGLSAAILEDSGSVRRFFVDHLLRDEVDAGLRRRLGNPFVPVLVSLKDEGEPRGGALNTVVGIVVPYFLSIFLVMTIFVSSGYLLRSVSEEKTSRVIEVVISSVTARELLAGKVLGLGTLGLTQVVVWLGSGLALSGGAVGLLGVSVPLFARPEVFVLGLVYYITGFLVYAVLMGSVGALGTTVQESQQLAGIFSMLAAVPLMLSGFTFSNPNMPLLRFLSWFPLTAPTTMMLRIPLVEVPTVDIVGSIVNLIVTIPIILWAGAKVFRMGLLMYGKRPTLAQVWRALREA